MSMFDCYEPVPPISCPECGAPASGWQGKDAENALLLWRQGSRYPVDHYIDDETRLSPAEMRSCTLPESFDIWTSCGTGHWLEAKGHTESGVWCRTDGVTAGGFTQRARAAQRAASPLGRVRSLLARIACGRTAT